MNYKKSKNKISFKPNRLEESESSTDIFPNQIISLEQNITSLVHINSFNNFQGSGNGNTVINFQRNFPESNHEKRIKELEKQLSNFEFQIAQKQKIQASKSNS